MPWSIRLLCADVAWACDMQVSRGQLVLSLAAHEGHERTLPGPRAWYVAVGLLVIAV